MAEDHRDQLKLPTNWSWELVKMQYDIERGISQAGDTFSDRWSGTFDQAIMHATYDVQQSAMIPNADGWTTTRVFIDKPLQEKTQALSDMIHALGQRVDAMQGNNEIQAMDAGRDVAVALSMQAADLRRDETADVHPDAAAMTSPLTASLEALWEQLEEQDMQQHVDRTEGHTQEQGMGY